MAETGADVLLAIRYSSQIPIAVVLTMREHLTYLQHEEETLSTVNSALAVHQRRQEIAGTSLSQP